MNKINLYKVTLLIIDCVNVSRAEKAIDICKYYADFGDIKFLSSLETTNTHHIKIEHINSRKEYSKFLLKKAINFVDTDYMLIIQYDGYILNPHAWTETFYKCDYIGSVINTKNSYWKDKKIIVGNGGFSLRSSKLMEYISITCNISDPNTAMEDWYICNYRYSDILQQNFYIPNDNHTLVNSFSIEGVKNKWVDSFGFHNTNISNWNHPLIIR